MIIHADPAVEIGVDATRLADALETECRLLAELGEVLRRQREGVARDDIQTVDESVMAAHRVMRTLGEAKKRRRLIVGMLLAAEDTPLDELELALGPDMTPRLATANARLRKQAHDVAREIEINRRVLSGALAQGDRFMQLLCGAQPAPSYDPAAPAGHGGVLINRQV